MNEWKSTGFIGLFAPGKGRKRMKNTIKKVLMASLAAGLVSAALPAAVYAEANEPEEAASFEEITAEQDDPAFSEDEEISLAADPKPVYTVDILLPIPKAGTLYEFDDYHNNADAWVWDSAPYTITFSSWYNEWGLAPVGATFEEGSRYFVEFDVEAKDGYEFRDSTKVKVNGVTLTTIFVHEVEKPAVNVRSATKLEAATRNYTITASNPAVTGISLEKTYTTVNVNSQVQLKASAGPPNAATNALTWTSNDPAVASVDSGGKVTGKKVGITYITPRTQSGGYSGNCYVRVQFTDVADSSKYYYAPVYWAYDDGITSGKNAEQFGPSDSCTRAQIVTFLWKAAGSPEPATTNNPFTDVSSSSYYYKAVLWAVENGITTGTSATTFSPNKTCTRCQAVTFIWNAKGKPADYASISFSDVKSSSYYYDAVRWAVKEGITSGTTATTFSPDKECTRAQIVTFLQNAYTVG